MMKIHFNSFGDQVYIISTVYVNIYHLDILAQKKKFIIKRKGTQTNPNPPSPPPQFNLPWSIRPPLGQVMYNLKL
jgi:hypothetical protein